MPVLDPAGERRDTEHLAVIQPADHDDDRGYEENGGVHAAGAEGAKGGRREIEGQEREHGRLDREEDGVEVPLHAQRRVAAETDRELGKEEREESSSCRTSA